MTHDLTLSDRERMLSLAAVTFTVFGVGTSFGMGFPLTSLTFELWQQPKWMIGLAGAVPAIAVLLVLPILPTLIARLGLVWSVASGCIVGSLGFLAMWAFPSPWAWLLIRLLMSAGFALPWLAGETWLNLIAPEEVRGRVIAVYAMAFFFGYAVGPFVLQALGLTGLPPFLAAAVITVLSCVPILIGREFAPEFSHDGTHNFASAFRIAPEGMLGGFIGGFAEITYLSLIPNVALAAGWSQDAALALLSTMTIGGIVLQFPIGWLSDKMSRFTVSITLGIALFALSLALPAALTSTTAALVLVFLMGGVILGFYSLGLAIVGERVMPSELGAANAAFIVMYQFGALIGPICAGIAMTSSPVIGFVWTVAGLMAASTIALTIFRQK